jgi:hypothetical protein
MIGKRFVLHPVFSAERAEPAKREGPALQGHEDYRVPLGRRICGICLVPARAVQNGNLILIPDELPSETAALAETVGLCREFNGIHAA